MPKMTTGTVFNRILASSQSDQLSRYSRSSFIHSSKAMLFRPLTCQRQVIPGFIENRRLCQSWYFSTSSGTVGRGPTMLM